MIDKELEKRDKRYHEGPLKKALNNVLVFILNLISYLPFWVIYGISDFLYFLLKNVVKYRKKVILENLSYAFPEKSEQEKNEIADKFYKHFCDFTLETVKLYSMDEKQMDKRLKFNGNDPIFKYAEEKISIIMLGFHYNNWEWCSSVQSKWIHQVLMIVNPMRGNVALDRFIAHSREKWGGESIPVHKSARRAIEAARRKEPIALWLAADQTPAANAQFWTMFLNREAPFFTGPDKIAMKTNQPVFFMHLKKIKRGHYEANFIELFSEPKNTAPNEIMLRYVQKMEEIIHETPEYYLWSHRRWKHQRPEGIELTV
ncbi:lysophospholipid acyltransferase family protein [Maribellus mangrovi]|uniref:lysophospholipid acyltransferase family protein n=1 Tax=Maribellus mangrovi TaxID=3133146 RepID=UPI0030EC8555